MLRLLIWDIDGTVAETEALGHRVAFNRAFEEAGLPWHWDEAEYTGLLRVAGGRERVLAYMQRRDDVPADAEARETLVRQLRSRKNVFYAEQVAQGVLKARPGVLRLMGECASEGVALAVATTSSRANVQALMTRLLGADWQQRFAAVVCAEDAQAKKPDPEVYRLALQRSGVPAYEAFALEDSPDGLNAALAAGIACGVTRSSAFADASFDGAVWVRDDLKSHPAVDLASIRRSLRHCSD